MDKDMLEALLTPKMLSKGKIIGTLTREIWGHAETLNNALENDKTLVVGREAGEIARKARLLLQVFNDETVKSDIPANVINKIKK